MSKPVRRCFVISPFGDQDSSKKADRDTWRIATEVKKLIDAAADRINQNGKIALQCFRGDEDPKVGVITEAIFRSIYRDHLIIAVLFKTNDNVSYEVGLAHAIARPVIILKHRNYKAPFDVQGHRYINFSDAALDSGTEREKVIADLYTQMRDHLPASGAPTFSANPFDGRAVPIGRCIPFDRFRFTFEEWSQLFQEAEKEIWLAGNTLHQLFYTASFSWPGETEQVSLSTVLTALLLDGCNVNILIMDETNPALNWRHLRFRKNQPEDAAVQRREGLHAKVLGTEKLVRGVIKTVAENPTLGRARGTLKFTKVQHGVLKQRVTMSEKRAFITPIFYSLSVNSGPAFDVYPKSGKELIQDDEYSKISLYKVVRDDLFLLQQTNPTLTMPPDGPVTDGLRTYEPPPAKQRSI